MQTTTNDFFKPLEVKLNKEVIKYAVQKKMFCPKTGAILDCRTAIMLEVAVNGKHVASEVFSPALVDNIATMKQQIEARVADSVVTFMTANKKLNNELLTILK